MAVWVATRLFFSRTTGSSPSSLLRSAHSTPSFLLLPPKPRPLNSAMARSASDRMANVTYPTPLDVLMGSADGSVGLGLDERTTKDDRTGPMSEKWVVKSTLVAAVRDREQAGTKSSRQYRRPEDSSLDTRQARQLLLRAFWRGPRT